ncbi:MAG: hypothetical protein JWQ46_2089 [Phenylobacterium sp.]|jgi:hypothetical protein|nr:hypothetical protein [Phenylobacterium sp.]
MGSQPPTENDPKGGESESPEDTVTRGNFEALAKGLFRVSPDQLKAEEARQAAAKKTAPVARRGSSRKA